MIIYSNNCPTPHGVGGLKYLGFCISLLAIGPTPHGVGGLKSVVGCGRGRRPMSHPSRGGWIEIFVLLPALCCANSPTPHGVGGLKFENVKSADRSSSPTPHGVGGLKYPAGEQCYSVLQSHPSRGGWIEMKKVKCQHNRQWQSHPSRGGWIEIQYTVTEGLLLLVPPLTGWWIEISCASL